MLPFFLMSTDPNKYPREAVNGDAKTGMDYKLSPEDSARIQCTAPAVDGGLFSCCQQQATHGQNAGRAPFWYHCDIHAEMYRWGRVYTLPGDPLDRRQDNPTGPSSGIGNRR
jgi:hypothetical protein